MSRVTCPKGPYRHVSNVSATAGPGRSPPRRSTTTSRTTWRPRPRCSATPASTSARSTATSTGLAPTQRPQPAQLARGHTAQTGLALSKCRDNVCLFRNFRHSYAFDFSKSDIDRYFEQEYVRSRGRGQVCGYTRVAIYTCTHDVYLQFTYYV